MDLRLFAVLVITLQCLIVVCCVWLGLGLMCLFRHCVGIWVYAGRCWFLFACCFTCCGRWLLVLLVCLSDSYVFNCCAWTWVGVCTYFVACWFAWGLFLVLFCFDLRLTLVGLGMRLLARFWVISHLGWLACLLFWYLDVIGLGCTVWCKLLFGCFWCALCAFALWCCKLYCGVDCLIWISFC